MPHAGRRQCAGDRLGSSPTQTAGLGGTRLESGPANAFLQPQWASLCLSCPLRAEEHSRRPYCAPPGLQGPPYLAGVRLSPANTHQRWALGWEHSSDLEAFPGQSKRFLLEHGLPGWRRRISCLEGKCELASEWSIARDSWEQLCLVYVCVGGRGMEPGCMGSRQGGSLCSLIGS